MRERGEEKQARSCQNDIPKKKKKVFIFHVHKKRKELNRTEVMRKSQEWLQQPRMEITLHLALVLSMGSCLAQPGEHQQSCIRLDLLSVL